MPLLVDRLHPKSVVDVGCGTGVWLAGFRDRGVTDVIGVDGAYIDTRQLRIPPDLFVSADLTEPLELGRSFDLALSLEVAEHLPGTRAERFVDTLTRLASIVLFSAAIPGQPGMHHVNLQWPDYWASLFAEHDYVCIDCIRPLLWRNADFEWYYAQNTLLYARRDNADRTASAFTVDLLVDDAPRALIHPHLFEYYKNAYHAQQHAQASAQGDA